MLQTEELSYLQESVTRDGLHHTMAEDDEVAEVDDKKFQKLRQAYLDATNALVKYCQIDLDE